jgi:hypothetical protein
MTTGFSSIFVIIAKDILDLTIEHVIEKEIFLNFLLMFGVQI